MPTPDTNSRCHVTSRRRLSRCSLVAERAGSICASVTSKDRTWTWPTNRTLRSGGILTRVIQLRIPAGERPPGTHRLDSVSQWQAHLASRSKPDRVAGWAVGGHCDDVAGRRDVAGRGASDAAKSHLPHANARTQWLSCAVKGSRRTVLQAQTMVRTVPCVMCVGVLRRGRAGAGTVKDSAARQSTVAERVVEIE